MKEESKPLAWDDVILLAAVTGGARRRRSIELRQLVAEHDRIDHSIPTYEEISFGIPRLVARGLVGSDGRTFWATTDAMAIRRSVDSRSLGGMVEELGTAVGASKGDRPVDGGDGAHRLAGFTARPEGGRPCLLPTDAHRYGPLVAHVRNWGSSRLVAGSTSAARPAALTRRAEPT